MWGIVGIKPNHAKFVNENDEIVLEAADDEAKEHIFVNGKMLEEGKRVLQPNDRIVFGTNSIFVFKHPEREKARVKKQKERRASAAALEEMKEGEEEDQEPEEDEEEDIIEDMEYIDYEFVQKELNQLQGSLPSMTP